MIKFMALAIWVLAALATVFVASLPLGVEAQFILAAATLAVMAAIKLMGLKGPFRSVFLGLGTFVILRYLFWRFSSTLPPIDSPADFIVGFLLIVAESYCVTMLFLSLFTVASPIERPKAPSFSEDDAPTVDIFVPSYNESIDIIAPTLAAAKRITYPKGRFTVYLLDDGSTQEKIHSEDPLVTAQARNRRRNLHTLCVELGVRYLTRDDNTHAKAGNLNNGLANSDGELVVVFDADHVPAQNFLEETVGFFLKDEKLFLVQTPHFFLNPDPIERNIGARRMPAENEMFYGLIQKGLDKWNAAFFCGSAAVLRREALEEVGGFHGLSVTEDAETALELHSQGWNSLYVDKHVVAGLQPETFESFIGQRSRWCRGMVQILLLKNPLFLPGLTVAQRLCYLSSSLFWLFPLSRMAFIIAPLLYAFFGMKIYVANGQEFLSYTCMYMASALMIQNYIFGKVRWPWTSDLYEYIQSVMLLPALLGVFVNPRAPKFNVTAKGQTLEENHLSRLALPYFVIFCIVALSLVMLGIRFVDGIDSRDLIVVVGVWTLFNLCLTGTALGAVSERRERRSTPRVAIKNHPASLIMGAEETPVAIEDMSFGGLRVRSLEQSYLPPRVSGILRIETGDPAAPSLDAPVISSGRRVRNEERGVGLKFEGLNGDRFRIVAETIYGDIYSIYEARTDDFAHPGVIRGTISFVLWAVNQTARGLYYVLFQRGRAPAKPSIRPTEAARLANPPAPEQRAA